jgi:membrane protein
MDTSDLFRGNGFVRRSLRLLVASAQEWIDGRAIRLGAAVAYYSLFALVPVLLLAIGLASIFIDQAFVASEVEAILAELLGSEAAAVLIDLISEYLQNDADIVVSIVGLGVLLFSATLLFVAWKDVVDITWQTPRLRGARGTLRRRSFGVLAVLGAGALLTISIMADAIIAYIGAHSDSGIVDLVVETTGRFLPVTLGAVFIGVLYKYTPEPEVSWGSVWFPAIATMVMLWIGAGIYGVYLTNYGFQSVTGVAGTVVLGLVLVYYASMILLYGMEMVKLLHEDTVPESISLRSSG